MSRSSLSKKTMRGSGKMQEVVSVALLLAVAGAVYALQGNPAFLYTLDRIIQVCIAVAPACLMAALCALLGACFIPRPAAEVLSLAERGIFGGLAVTSGLAMGTFVLGTAGLLSPWAAWLILAFAAALCAVLLRKFSSSVIQNSSTMELIESEKWTAAHLFLCAILSIIAMVLFVSALAPPLVYDVTEYHLGAFRDYTSRGHFQIVPVPHNMYARFPFPIESLYFFGLLLETPNDFSPKLLNLFMIGGLGALVWNWQKRLGIRRTYRLITLILVVTHPVMLEVSLDAYIDAPVALFVLATLYAGMLVGGELSQPISQAPQSLLPFFGLLAGSMLVTKYTSAQLYALPFLITLIVPLWRAFFACAPRVQLTTIATFCLPLAAWLGKNVFFYGNPLEPFFCWLFKPYDVAAVARERFYIESHYPQSPLSSAYWLTLLPRLEAIGWFYLAPLAGLPLVMRQRHIKGLITVCAISYLLWNLTRYSQDRFLLPTIVIVIMIAAEILQEISSQLTRVTAVAVLLAGAASAFAAHTIRIANGGEFEYLGKFCATHPSRNLSVRAEFYRKNLGALGETVTTLNRSLPHDSRILLIYEARPYLFERRCVYNTVFDESELLRLAKGASSVDEITSRLLAAGITHVLINREELRRFIDQYARPEQLRSRGIRSVVEEFPRIDTPEDLYPPFYCSPQWPTMRNIVIAWLQQMSARAFFRAGREPVEISVTSLRSP